jgi:RNA polymerase sigma-32 factor
MAGRLQFQVGMTDSFEAYVARVIRRPVIDPAAELAAARRYAATGDPDAMRQLVEGHLRLVVMLAHQLRGAHASLADLVQEGNLGLILAVRRFDPERGVKLSTYGASWIRAFMLRYLMRNFSSVRIGTNQRERRLFFGLRKQQRAIGGDVGALAQQLQVTEREIQEMDQRLGGVEVSLDMENATGGRLGDFLPSPTPGPEEQLAEREAAHAANATLARLTRELALDDKDRCILEERLFADEPLLLADIGRRFGISRERVRQREVRLRARLRQRMAA